MLVLGANVAMAVTVASMFLFTACQLELCMRTEQHLRRFTVTNQLEDLLRENALMHVCCQTAVLESAWHTLACPC